VSNALVSASVNVELLKQRVSSGDQSRISYLPGAPFQLTMRSSLRQPVLLFSDSTPNVL